MKKKATTKKKQDAVLGISLSVTLSIVYLNISKAVALNVLILSCRIVSTTTTISVDI